MVEEKRGVGTQGRLWIASAISLPYRWKVRKRSRLDWSPGEIATLRMRMLLRYEIRTVVCTRQEFYETQNFRKHMQYNCMWWQPRFTSTLRQRWKESLNVQGSVVDITTEMLVDFEGHCCHLLWTVLMWMICKRDIENVSLWQFRWISSVIRGETIAVCEHSVNILCCTVSTVQGDLHEAGGEDI